MRVMIIRKADAETEAGVMPSAELATNMTNYMQEMCEAGVLLDPGNGLKPTVDAVRIAFAKGQPKVLDGPFAETKELIAGYSILEVASMAEAVEWARRWPEPEVTLELRPLYEIADFGDAFSEDQVAQHAKMREQA